MGRMTWTVTAGADCSGMMNLTAYDILSANALSTRLDVSVGGSSSTFVASLTGNERGGNTGVSRFEILIGDDTLDNVLAGKRKNLSVESHTNCSP